MIVAAALAAGALLAPTSRARALAMLAALVITPVLLAADVWDTPQLEPLRDRPAAAAAGAAIALLALCGAAWLFARRRWLFAALAVAAVPFRVPLEIGGTTASLLVPLYAVIGAGGLAWIVPRLRRGAELDPPRENGWLERLLAISLVLYALQAAYSGDADKALEQVVFFYVPFTILFALLRELDWSPVLVRRCFTVVVVLALIFTAIGFWEYFQRELLLNPKVIAQNQFQAYFRVNSLFFDPNIYGRFLALVMTGLAAVVLWSRAPRTLWLSAAALAVLWAGLLLTLSRSSFAALLAGLVVIAALRWRPWKTLAAAGVAIAVGAAIVLAFPAKFNLDFSSDKAVDKAASGRLELVEGGVRLARARPVHGFGSGSFSFEYRRREKAPGERATSASHTIPITVAAEQGVIGLAVYFALLLAALWRLLGGASRSGARAAVAAAFVALVVHTWLYAAFLEDPLVWTLLGVGVALARRQPPEPDPG